MTMTADKPASITPAVTAVGDSDLPGWGAPPAPSKAPLFAALAAVQAELPRVLRGEEADIPGKDGKRGFKYKYADLADIVEAIMPLLGKNGLAFTAWPTMADRQFILAYSLVHESGATMDGVYPLPNPATTDAQKVGSAITYGRRYILLAVTGVAPAGEDDDGAAAAGGYESAGAAFEKASPVRPGTMQPSAGAPQHGRPSGPPVTTDVEWLETARKQVIEDSLSEKTCRALWVTSAAKVREGTLTKGDAADLQLLLGARIKDARDEARAAALALLPDDDPWAVKVAGLTSPSDAGEVIDEVQRLLAGKQIDAEKAGKVITAVTTMYPDAPDNAPDATAAARTAAAA